MVSDLINLCPRSDCYVAVCGLPDPRRDHTVIMARFAMECLFQLSVLLTKLEMLLGPDTADLGMRVGLHTGPVTAGVLRGERSRFQLFGDTMNTASRMESTGMRNMIQVSQEVADQLINALKSHWIKPRRDLVFVKGKGEMQTYWLVVPGVTNEIDGSSALIGSDESKLEMSSSERTPETLISDLDTSNRRRKILSEKASRLVNWNADVLVRLLRDIVARRKAAKVVADSDTLLSRWESKILNRKEIVLTEVKEIIKMPEYTKFHQNQDQNLQVSAEVVRQLQKFLEASEWNEIVSFLCAILCLKLNLWNSLLKSLGCTTTIHFIILSMHHTSR